VAGCSCISPKKASERQIYDPKADGTGALDLSLEKAQQSGKHVLLSMGANWCSDSQKMYDIFTTNPEIQNELESHYVLTMVDVNDRSGRRRNQALIDRLSVSPEQGIPIILVLDQDGRLLNVDPSERLKDSDHAYPEKVLAYLKKWSGTSTHIQY